MIDLLLAAWAGFATAAAIHWHTEVRRTRRRQFETAMRLSESRKGLLRLMHNLIGANKKLAVSTERADELNELAAAYVLISQLEELREEPRAPSFVGKETGF